MKEYIFEIEEEEIDEAEVFVGWIRKHSPELIRCKDCKYWQLEHYVGGQCMSCQMMNSDDVCPTEPTHFCGWAERKEE